MVIAAKLHVLGRDSDMEEICYRRVLSLLLD